MFNFQAIFQAIVLIPLVILLADGMNPIMKVSMLTLAESASSREIRDETARVLGLKPAIQHRAKQHSSAISSPFGLLHQNQAAASSKELSSVANNTAAIRRSRGSSLQKVRFTVSTFDDSCKLKARFNTKFHEGWHLN